MNETNTKIKLNCETPIIVLSIISIISCVISLLAQIMISGINVYAATSVTTETDEYHLYEYFYDLFFESKPPIIIICTISVLSFLFFKKYFYHEKSLIFIKIIFILLLLTKICTVRTMTDLLIGIAYLTITANLFFNFFNIKKTTWIIMLIVVCLNFLALIKTTPLIYYDMSIINMYFSLLAMHSLNFSWFLFTLKNKIVLNIATVEKIKGKRPAEALEILQENFDRGNISKEEYNNMRKDIIENI